MGMRFALRDVLRSVGSVALGLLTALGIGSAALWLANACGLVQPLIVTSGSMSPHMDAGDLILATPTMASDVAVGEVVTLPSSLKDALITHRVTSATVVGEEISFEMKGDANDAVDPETYTVAVDAPVWQPAVVLSGAGHWVMMLMQPQVAVPMAGGTLALVALALLPSRASGAGATDGGTRPAPAGAPARTAIGHVGPVCEGERRS